MVQVSNFSSASRSECRRRMWWAWAALEIMPWGKKTCRESSLGLVPRHTGSRENVRMFMERISSRWKYKEKYTSPKIYNWFQKLQRWHLVEQRIQGVAFKRASALEDHVSKGFTAVKWIKAVQVQTDPDRRTQCVWGLLETKQRPWGWTALGVRRQE